MRSILAGRARVEHEAVRAKAARECVAAQPAIERVGAAVAENRVGKRIARAGQRPGQQGEVLDIGEAETSERLMVVVIVSHPAAAPALQRHIILPSA